MSRMSEHHHRIEALFSDLLSSQSQMPSDGTYWVAHYIDHGEYELALENAIASFRDDGRSISRSGKDILREIAETMGCTASIPMIETLRETP